MWREEHAANIRGLEIAHERAKTSGRAALIAATQAGLDAERAGEPPRDAAMVLCLRAWNDLETCRSIGMGLGPIPVTAILQWCAAEGLDREATQVIRDVIRMADSQFMEQQASRRRHQNITGGQ